MGSPRKINGAMLGLIGVSITALTSIIVAIINKVGGNEEAQSVKMINKTIQEKPNRIIITNEIVINSDSILLQEYFIKLADPNIKYSHKVQYIGSASKFFVENAEFELDIGGIPTNNGIDNIIDYMKTVICLRTKNISFRLRRNQNKLIDKITIYEN